jgi:hypothetical protein
MPGNWWNVWSETYNKNVKETREKIYRLQIRTVITQSLLQSIMCSHICRLSEQSQRHLVPKTKFRIESQSFEREHKFVCSYPYRTPRICRTWAQRNWSKNVALRCSFVISPQYFACYHEVKFRPKPRGRCLLRHRFSLILERCPIRNFGRNIDYHGWDFSCLSTVTPGKFRDSALGYVPVVFFHILPNSLFNVVHTSMLSLSYWESL